MARGVKRWNEDLREREVGQLEVRLMATESHKSLGQGTDRSTGLALVSGNYYVVILELAWNYFGTIL